jgi:hypothetical protein
MAAGGTNVLMRVVPILVLALLVAGCGAAPSPEQAVSDTGEQTAEAGSARIVVSYDRVETVGGAFDFANGSGVLDASETTQRTIITPDFVYELISDELLIQSGRRPKWLKWELSAMPPMLLEPFASSPRELFAFFAAANAPEEVGEGEERGEPVTRYAATVDTERFLAAVPADVRADLRDAFLDFWPESATEGVPVQLALDSDGRLRRADVVTYDGEEIVVEIFDYGVEVGATAPPASEVITWAEYEKLLRKECEALKKKGLEKTMPHCVGGCSAGEGEGEA